MNITLSTQSGQVGNLFANLSSNSIVKDFTNNQAEAVNKQFKKKFINSPVSLVNILLRTKEFKKDYLQKKADTMGSNLMRKKPAAQIMRAENREICIRDFHFSDQNTKVHRLIDTLEAISSC